MNPNSVNYVRRIYSQREGVLFHATDFRTIHGRRLYRNSVSQIFERSESVSQCAHSYELVDGYIGAWINRKLIN